MTTQPSYKSLSFPLIQFVSLDVCIRQPISNKKLLIAHNMVICSTILLSMSNFTTIYLYCLSVLFPYAIDIDWLNNCKQCEIKLNGPSLMFTNIISSAYFLPIQCKIPMMQCWLCMHSGIKISIILMFKTYFNIN